MNHALGLLISTFIGIRNKIAMSQAIIRTDAPTPAPINSHLIPPRRRLAVASIWRMPSLPSVISAIGILTKVGINTINAGTSKLLCSAGRGRKYVAKESATVRRMNQPTGYFLMNFRKASTIYGHLVDHIKRGNIVSHNMLLFSPVCAIERVSFRANCSNTPVIQAGSRLCGLEDSLLHRARMQRAQQFASHAESIPLSAQ